MPDIIIHHSNPSQTVGLVEMYNPKEDFICEVNPALLKEWADLVAELAAGEDVVYIAMHKHPDPMNTTRHLAASAEYGDEMQAVVCGTDCDDVAKRGSRL